MRGEHPISVVHTIASLRLEHGGPSRSVAALASALARRGADITLIATTDHDADTRVPVDPSVSVVALGARRGVAGLIDLRRRFAYAIDRLPAGHTRVIHDHGLWLPSNREIARGARHASAKRVVSPRGMLSPWALHHHGFKKRIAWNSYQRRDLETAAGLHVTSTMEREEARALGLTLPIAVIPNGVSLPPNPALRAREGSQRTALFLSRINPKKGLINLIQAWSSVRPRDWRLIIAGPDEHGHRSEIERLVAREKLKDDVAFVGELDDEQKWNALLGADIFVLPTFSENFGIAVAEAMAAGLPVITTKGAPWSCLASERAGWWVNIDVNEITHALREATSADDLTRHEMGCRARKIIERDYGWEAAATNMLVFYNWLLHRGNAPPFVQLR